MRFADREWRIFWALSQRIVTPLADTSQTEEGFRRAVDRAMEQRPVKVVVQLGAFLNLINTLPAFRYGKRFINLPAQKQDAVISWFQDAPINVFRKGTWGIKTFAFMGFYGQEEVAATINYRPTFSGNDILEKNRRGQGR